MARPGITVLSWMRDEADMVPFFLRHYSFADRIVVWDNESSDGTRRMLESDPRVEVREWRTCGVMDDESLTRMKNEECRGTGPGWKIVVDADEFLWHLDLPGQLERYDAAGVTIPRVAGYDMVSQEMPKDDGVSLLTDLVRQGVPNPLYDKWCVFRECVSVSYAHGAHLMAEPPKGRAVTTKAPGLKLLHYRYMGLRRTVRKAMAYVRSPRNVEIGAGADNCDARLMAERWNCRWLRKVDVI